MVNYATETEVRLRHGFHTREYYEEGDGEISVGSTILSLNHESDLIITLRKSNGATSTLLTSPTDYAFSPPKNIVLVTPVASNDIFSVDYGTELTSVVIDYYLEQATETVKAYLKDRYGDTKLTEWESSTPPLIKHITAELAGFDAERAMLRGSHKFVPEAMEMLNREYNRLLKQLRNIKSGKEDIPLEAGLRSGSEEVIRGLSSVSVFSSLSNLNDVDMNQVDEDLGTDGSVFD